MTISEDRGSTPLASTNIYAIIQARMNSSRLPGKVMLEAAGKPMLVHLIERLERAWSLDEIILATTLDATDEILWDVALANDVLPHAGSENDVLERVLGAAHHYDVDVIVQVTADNPLLDPAVVDHVVEAYFETDCDYASNMLDLTYPVGQNVDVFSTEILEDVARRTDGAVDHEHVSLYIYSNPQIYKLLSVKAPPELTAPHLRLTVDEPADYELVKTVFERLYPQNPVFPLIDILNLVRDDPALAEINRHVRQR